MAIGLVPCINFKTGWRGRGRGRNSDISAEASLWNLKFVTKKKLHCSNFGDEKQQEVEFKFLIWNNKFRILIQKKRILRFNFKNMSVILKI